MVRVVQRGAQRTKAIVSGAPQLLAHRRRERRRLRPRSLDRRLARAAPPPAQAERHGRARSYGDVGRVRGHAGQINQVFMNLLTNAAQALAGRDDATITIETAGDADGVVVKIARQRPGHPARGAAAHLGSVLHDQGRRRGHRPRPVDRPRLVERHGGTIEVDTKLGEGTTFTVTLPRKIPVAARPTERRGSRRGKRGDDRHVASLSGPSGQPDRLARIRVVTTGIIQANSRSWMESDLAQGLL